MDRNLRDLLEAAVGEPPRWVSLEAVRRRAVRRRTTQIGVTSLAAVVAIVLGTTLSAGAVGSSSPVSSGKISLRPPAFYLADDLGQKPGQDDLVVRSTTTGRVTAVVHNPKAGETCGEDFAAASGDRFFVVCTTTGWTGSPTSIESLIYQFKVGASGKVSGYSLVKNGTVKGAFADHIAVAPNGSEVAVEIVQPEPSGKLYTNTVPKGIVVINTRTGHQALWRSGPYQKGAIQYAGAEDISFTRDGSELVIDEGRCPRSRYQSDCSGKDDTQVRAYSPAPDGGSLERGQVLLPESILKPAGTALVDALVTPDGSMLNALIANCPPRGACRLAVVQVPLRAGLQTPWRVLYRTRTGTKFEGYFERFFASDPSGHYLILDAGQGNARVNGWIHNLHLVPLTPRNGNAVNLEAW